MDETWSLKRAESDPQKRSKQQQQLQPHERLIEVEKSRSGRSGTHLILGQSDDLDFYIADFTLEMDPDDTAPSSVQGRVLSRLRTAYPESRTKTDLMADRLVAGSPAAIDPQQW